MQLVDYPPWPVKGGKFATCLLFVFCVMGGRCRCDMGDFGHTDTRSRADILMCYYMRLQSNVILFLCGVAGHIMVP